VRGGKMSLTISGYLFGSTHADDVAMCTLGRVSVALRAAVKLLKYYKTNPLEWV